MKNRLYIIYFEWPNTSGNHAGMAHLVKELKRAFPKHVKPILIPQSIDKWPLIFQRLHFYILLLYLKSFLAKTDKVLFMEYMGNISGNQTGIAIKLRKWGVKNKIIGLVHLSGKNLLELYGTIDYIKQGAEAADFILVFGSSLAKFFYELGFERKIISTLHYVDTNFYKPSPLSRPENLQVIHIGSLKRNFDHLGEIVRACPDIEFHICQGRNNLSEYFKEQKNVKLYGFLSEEELLKLMQYCHVSLSVIDDTVGSNVICTSLACGLINVVSDVGSIRDYCNSENSILCSSTSEFISALEILSTDKNILNTLSEKAVSDSSKFSLDISINFFNSL